MPLLYSQIETQKSPGTTATTVTSNTALNYTSHIQHLDVYCLKNTTTASSLSTMVGKITNVQMNTQGGTPEINYVGKDLYDFNVTGFGYSPYISVLSSTDDVSQAFALPYFYSPYPEDPTEPYGIQPLQLNQVNVVFAADGTHTFDTYTYDLYFEGAAPKTSNGYLVSQVDQETMSVGGPIWTKAYGKNLLGVFNFMTNFIDALTGSASPNTTTIRTQAVTFSRNVIFGPFTPMRAGSTNPNPWITASPPVLLNNADHFQDFGMFNRTGNGGINIANNPNVEIQTIGGDTNSARIYPIVLR